MSNKDREVRKKSSAELAAGMFARAARDFSGSVSFQACAMALECKAQMLDPQILWHSLRTDNAQMANIVQTTNNVHIARNVVDENGDPLAVDLTETSRVVRSAFTVATFLQPIPEEAIRGFQRLFPFFRKEAGSVGLDAAEDLYRGILYSIIDKYNPPTVNE